MSQIIVAALPCRLTTHKLLARATNAALALLPAARRAKIAADLVRVDRFIRVDAVPSDAERGRAHDHRSVGS
jgi:hypothetical protein